MYVRLLIQFQSKYQNCFIKTKQTGLIDFKVKMWKKLSFNSQFTAYCVQCSNQQQGFVFPLASDSLRGGVFNLLKSEIAEVKPSMHAFCLLKTATAFSLMI